MNDLFESIREWGIKRGIMASSNVEKQCLKTQDELGELSKAILHGNESEFIDAIGDVAVCLVMLAELGNHRFGKPSGTISFPKCVQSAYAEISGREGEMVDGVFVKKEDRKDG